MSPRLHDLGLAAVAALSIAGVSTAHAWPAARDTAYLGPITLAVDATDQDRKILRVRETLPVKPGRLTLLYPKWIPGNHAPNNEVKRLAGLRIEAAGTALPWKRDPDDFHAIMVDVPAGASTIDVQFQQLLPLEPNGKDAALNHRFIDVEWQGAVLYPAGYYASRIDIDASLRLPAGWQHGSALRPIGLAPGAAAPGGEPLRFERVSLETLLDSPVFAGRYGRRIPLDDNAQRPVVLSVFADDAASLVTTEEQLAPHRNLITQADRLFGARHYAHYDLLAVLSEDSYGLGLEHHQSSENSFKSGYFRDGAKNAVERGLFPHEYTHSWNGKFRRPRDLWAPDYNAVARNSLLWVYEGQTQYWGEVLTARSGLIGLADMRDRYARTAAYLQTLPGRTWRALQDTTDDEIMAGRIAPLEWTSWQRFEDYYDEGALIWLDADTKIRELSGGQRSLDDFARAFFGVEDGRVAPLLYEFRDVVAQLNQVQPYDWATFLRTRLDRVGPNAPLEGLERAGWRLGWTDKQSESAKDADSLFESSDFAYSIGIRVGKDDHIDDVVWDSPAFRAGLTRGVTLLAIDGRGYKSDLLNDAITAAKDGTAPIELLVKDGSDYRTAKVDWHGGLRYPQLERIEGVEDRLTQILTPR